LIFLDKKAIAPYKKVNKLPRTPNIYEQINKVLSKSQIKEIQDTIFSSRGDIFSVRRELRAPYIILIDINGIKTVFGFEVPDFNGFIVGAKDEKGNLPRKKEFGVVRVDVNAVYVSFVA